MTTTAPEPTAQASAAERRAAAMWVTRLFADADAPPVCPTTTSAFAAYQDAIYDRAVIADLRTPLSRRRDGRIPEGLAVTVNAASPAGYADLLGLAATTPVVLVTDDPANGARLAAHLSGLGPAEVTVMAGGFPSWRVAGLPLG